MSTTIAGRVALGAAFLDEHDPNWWRADAGRPIDLDKLDLGDSGLCVLGQCCPLEVLAEAVEASVSELHGDDFGDAYDAYAGKLSGLSGEDRLYWARDHGFTILASDPDAEADNCPAFGLSGLWDELTGEWKRVITERRTA